MAESKAQKLPNVWGPGQLLAFSGLDGPTDYHRPLVLHTGAAPGSLVLRLPLEATIELIGAPALKFRYILGDVIVADSQAGVLQLAFVDRNRLVAQLPEGVGVAVNGQELLGRRAAMLTADSLAVSLAAEGGRFALAVTAAGDDAGQSLAAALAGNIDAAVKARTAYVRKVDPPAGLSAGRERLFRKAVSVLKVNVEGPCGEIRRRWTTPDRWPHRAIWLWDSALHAMALAGWDGPMAQDALNAMLEQIRESGMMPHTTNPLGQASNHTQPPILAWGVWAVLQRTGDEDWARQSLPALQRYLDWIVDHRAGSAEGVYRWFVEEGDHDCRSGESGQDNSPRFDRDAQLDAPDLSAFLCHDYACLAQLYDRLGESAHAREASARAEAIADAVREHLWSPEHRLFMDRRADGGFIDVKAVGGLLPLLAGIPDGSQAGQLAGHLEDPTTFGAPLPCPSVALDHGTLCKDMWRGPTWINTNYFIYLGLRRYGQTGSARRLREITLDAIQRWYEQTGCVYEYYDAIDLTPPHDLDRKRRLSTGRGFACISDYNWTAAMTALLIADEAAEG